MPRVWLDASTLIALARIGELDILPRLLDDVWTTRIALTEATPRDAPGTEAIARAVGAWLQVADVVAPAALGAGAGEASVIHAAGDHDIVVLDDRNARRLADVKRLARTGLLGLLVAGARSGALAPDEALRVLDRLADSGFRMSAQLYRDARARIEASR